MTRRTEVWLYGLAATAISGGASAIINGIATMGLAPDKFNLTDLKGFGHLFALMTANFLLSGFISMAFYFKQSPLPPESTGNTDIFTKAKDETPKIPNTDLPHVP